MHMLHPGFIFPKKSFLVRFSKCCSQGTFDPQKPRAIHGHGRLASRMASGWGGSSAAARCLPTAPPDLLSPNAAIQFPGPGVHPLYTGLHQDGVALQTVWGGWGSQGRDTENSQIESGIIPRKFSNIILLCSPGGGDRARAPASISAQSPHNTTADIASNKPGRQQVTEEQKRKGARTVLLTPVTLPDPGQNPAAKLLNPSPPRDQPPDQTTAAKLLRPTRHLTNHRTRPPGPNC